MPLEPLRLEPIRHPRAWGEELWLLADLPEGVPNGRSRIVGGVHGGRTVHDLMRDPALRASLLGRTPAAAHGGFPLLLKVLDAREDLSVQVHPSPEYAAHHPGAHVKSELWVVLHAEPGARIYRGIRHGIARHELARLIQSDRVIDAMLSIDARQGDCIYLPSGTCHALGAGIRVAEVQTPSDTTFRVWDWGRRDASRPLHVEQALACMRLGDEQSIEHPHAPPPVSAHGTHIETLVRSGDFTVERIRIEAGESLHQRGSGAPVAWMPLEGGVEVPGLGTLARGEAAILPADRAPLEARSRAGATLLQVLLPDPMLQAPATPAARRA